ncbi:hypothetical protein GWI33_005050 [Rhynchophorus ferrugineus]|uniref:Nucleolar 27S pre-rRNA processing Urb2/Npa2 C-terminal domain-containing protein n=1 Tax=Rhynchophorus ferrugineus TaxID=354439 RepID=A0A834II65_RHYFE|nr:hypothetical protein GWI33_005050 [Rhynchophorus ferrugineus]
MAVLTELLDILENSEEPLSKRIKLADHAFNLTQLPIQHKEALLLKWAFKNISDSENIWNLIDKWLGSEQFQDLVQNNISSDDISSLIEVFLEKIELLSLNDPLSRELIKDTTLILASQRIFYQYFKHNIKVYCKFLSRIINKIDCPTLFIEFIKDPRLLTKTFLIHEKFCKYFLDFIYPELVAFVLKHENNAEIFQETCKFVQKSLFQENVKKIEIFFKEKKEGDVRKKRNVLQDIFKYFISAYELNHFDLHFKLILHSLCQNSDSHLIYKLCVVTLSFFKFNMRSDFNIQFSMELNSVALSKCINILSILFNEVATKTFSEIKISNVTTTDFMGKMIKTLIALNIPTSKVYDIFLSIISINPLTIEPLVNHVVIFLMTANNCDQVSTYEKLVISIFDVFSKLHRTENFIAKLIQALKTSLVDKVVTKIQADEIFQFNGDCDILVPKVETLSAKMILTENILQCFTNSINTLASWQVINLMKTFLYHFNVSVKDYLKEQTDNDTDKLIFVEILGTLFCQLLQSVRMADHTIPQNVVTKFENGLNELKDILKEFGSDLLKKEHNHITMRTFLNMAYVWAEVCMTLSFYSINKEVKITTVMDNTYTACNLMYLHSYMDVHQWQLISQRIMNFGEYPCKKLLQKLFIQKLRGMLLFDESITEDITLNIVKTLQEHLEDTWKDLLSDKFCVCYIVPKMDVISLTSLSEHLIEDNSLQDVHHIKDSPTLMNSMLYVIMSKLSKLFKTKRKHGEDSNKGISSKVFSLVPNEVFFNCTESYDLSDVIAAIKEMNKENEKSLCDFGNKEEKALLYLKNIRRIPVICSSVDIQKMVLLYLYYLHGDIRDSEMLKSECECLIIGILQNCKFQLIDIFDLNLLCTKVLNNFEQHQNIFPLIVENVFKNDDAIKGFDSTISGLLNKVDSSKYLKSVLVILQAVNKQIKSKKDTSAKETANNYKEKILNKLVKQVCKSEFLVEAYGTCLKHYLSLGQQSEILDKLSEKLPTYMEYALANISSENKKGCVILFATVLHNKQKLPGLDENVVLNVWNAVKSVDIEDEYSHLVNLIFTLIPNDEFSNLVGDLLQSCQKSSNSKNYSALSRQLKIWQSILTCNVNPVKMKIWQEALEKLIHQLQNIIKNDNIDLAVIRNIFSLQESIILTQHFTLSSPLIDLFLINVSILTNCDSLDFEDIFNISVSLLEKLLKYRNAIILDRLPPFLQQYRTLLKLLCDKSNSDENENAEGSKKASDCAHKLEKLTKNLVLYKKDVSRISVYLIADILERYEQINLYPNVKLHLNNCVYSLVSLCDHHGVSYLMRVLSSASTEMFKILYEHYKRYYMFTGKV